MLLRFNMGSFWNIPKQQFMKNLGEKQSVKTVAIIFCRLQMSFRCVAKLINLDVFLENLE